VLGVCTCACACDFMILASKYGSRVVMILVFCSPDLKVIRVTYKHRKKANTEQRTKAEHEHVHNTHHNDAATQFVGTLRTIT
jgi:hypothetical protein